jgi:hypothetical protein
MATVMINAEADWSLEEEGVLLHDCQMCDAMPYATDPNLADRLWKLSEELVGSRFEF